MTRAQQNFQTAGCSIVGVPYDANLIGGRSRIHTKGSHRRLFGAAGPAVSSHAAQDRALALLKERYAKGEIDSTEFAERKKLLAD